MAHLSPRRQGDLGELSALQWLVLQGYDVFIPLGHSPDIDLIADDGEELLRVQVKTTTQFRHGRWQVTICTRGGNRSWSGLVKHFSAERCDRLFVLVADGRRWFMPSTAVDGSSGVVLGGPKYAQFEVDPGRPLPSPEDA
jgi:Holliday junction resolvase-like predicted endonuclease